MTFKIAVSAKKLQEMITGEQTAFSLKEIREFLEKLPGDSELKEMAGSDEVRDIVITLLANALCERHIASQQKICNLLRSQAESLQSAPKNASGEGTGTETAGTETAGSEAAVPVTAVGTEPAGDLEDLLADDDFTDIPMDPVSGDDDDGWSEFCDSLNEELADCSEADDDAETADAPGDGAEGAADPEPVRRRHRREFSKKHAPSEEEKRLQDLIRTELPYYKENHTLHFDRQVKFTSEDSVRKMAAMLNNPEEIARHSFYPLISSSQKTRQKRKIEEYRFYRKTLETATDPAIISLCKEQTEKFLKNGPVKIRPIRICSHLDSLIYARYSRLLEEKYEEYIRDLGISDSVIAYRKTGRRVINGVRVEFPNIAAVYDVVQFIRSRNCQCTALSVDLSSFFDSIDHQSLKEEWQNVLGVSELPPDHYNLFRSLTNYCYVEKDEIRKYIEAWKQEEQKSDPGKQEPEKSGGDNASAGQKVAGERVSKGSGKTGTDGTGSAGTADAATGIAESAAGTDDAGSTGTGETAAAGAGKSGTGEAAGSRAQPEKESYAASFCKCFHRGSDFRRFRRWYRDNPDHAGFASFHPNPGLVKEGRSYGIPQGLSISSVLSNIYMIKFDQAMADFAREHGCLYRRYCDDILLVGPSDEAFMDRAYDFLLKQVEARGEQLKIHPYYKNFRNPYSKSKMHDFTSPQIRELPLQYLGFYFDGENVRIREASIAKFYREMQASVTALRYRKLGVANSLFQKDPGYLAANDLDKVRLICVRHVGEKELSGEIRQLIGKCSEEAARKIANRCSDLLRRLDDFTEESESRQRLSRFIIGDVDQKTGRMIYRRAFLPSLKKLHRLYSFRSTKSFMNYALNAAAVLDDPEHGRNTIRHQFRSHSTHLSRMVRRAYLLNCEELKRLVARLLRQGLLG